MSDQFLIDKISEGLKDKVVAITNPAPGAYSLRSQLTICWRRSAG